MAIESNRLTSERPFSNEIGSQGGRRPALRWPGKGFRAPHLTSGRIARPRASVHTFRVRRLPVRRRLLGCPSDRIDEFDRRRHPTDSARLNPLTPSIWYRCGPSRLRSIGGSRARPVARMRRNRMANREALRGANWLPVRDGTAPRVHRPRDTGTAVFTIPRPMGQSQRQRLQRVDDWHRLLGRAQW
jgi:hypothetical protein